MKPFYDALVIGSGFGGAVAACRLAQAGISVGLLERGRRYPAGSFPRDIADPRAGWLFEDRQGLFDIKPINELMILQAAGLGGGSLIYANVHLRAPSGAFRERWPSGYSRQALDPYYDLAAYMLDAKPITASSRGEPTKTKRMRLAAERLGRSPQWFEPNLALNYEGTPERPVTNRFGAQQVGCTYCGECIIGCNVHAKNTLDLNYIAVAEQNGCDVFTQTEVMVIRPGAQGFSVSYLDHQADRRGTVDAQWVFVCAGAVNTSELLLRCRDQYRTLPLLGDALGRRYSANGDYLTFAVELSEPFEPSVGPTITSALLHDRMQPEGHVWFLLEDGGFPTQIAPLARFLDLLGPVDARQPFTLAQARQLLGALLGAVGSGADRQNRGAFFLMGRDRADGRIGLLPFSHRLLVEWETRKQLPLYQAQGRLAADVAGALGGRAVDNPFWHWLKLPMTVHNLGGCSMADSPAEGVVDANCEAFAYPGLFVMDGSVLPAATGVNPSATIAALAERNVEHFVRTRLGRADWQAPERRVALAIVEPADGVIVPANGTVAPGGERTGVVFPEELQGFFVRERDGSGVWVKARLTIVVNELGQLFSEGTSSASATGLVWVTGLTEEHGARVTGGVVRLSVSEDSQPRVEYVLPLSDAGGRPFILEAARGLFSFAHGSRSSAAIRSAQNAGSLYARGSLQLASGATLRALTRAELVGSATPRERARVLSQAVGRLAGVVGRRHSILLRRALRPAGSRQGVAP